MRVGLVPGPVHGRPDERAVAAVGSGCFFQYILGGLVGARAHG